MKTPTPLQREIRQRRPFASAAHEGVVSVMRTADLLRRQMAALVEPFGITVQQFNVLRILRGGGPDGLPTLEVGARMIEETPGVTRLLDRLETKGLVRRQRCPKDRRQHLCWITQEGLDLLASLDDEVLRSSDEALKGLTRDQQSALVRLLDRLRSAHA
jgi:MarR family transcriptional regulator, organic hydroperoxide resistance regulator